MNLTFEKAQDTVHISVHISAEYLNAAMFITLTNTIIFRHHVTRYQFEGIFRGLITYEEFSSINDHDVFPSHVDSALLWFDSSG